MITKRDIILSLELLGVRPGDTLLLHSAITAIGEVEGGADTVIDAFLAALGPAGTLCMSAFSFSSEPFDADTTPTSVGYLAETFRRRTGVMRSLHPVHSVAACGRNAAFITSGHEDAPTGCGEGTPYTKIRDLGGKILLLGVDLDRNTSLHCIEEFVDSSYLVESSIIAPTYRPDLKTFIMKKFPPGHRDFKGVTPAMRRAGILREGRIGNAVVRLMDVKTIFDWGMEQLHRDPFYFLCDSPYCKFCSEARAKGSAGKKEES